MISFAVTIAGVHDPGQGCWVLACDREGVLVAYGDGSLHWHPYSDCTFLRAQTPDQPLAVLPVSPQRVGIVRPNGMPSEFRGIQ